MEPSSLQMITLRQLQEKAVSKQQQKLMGLALAYKRGDVPDAEVSDTVRNLAKSMSTKELEKYASTKHKGLPQKVSDSKLKYSLKGKDGEDVNVYYHGTKNYESVEEAVEIDARKKTFRETMKRLQTRKQKIAEKELSKKMGPLEIGTDEIVRRYTEMTPGQTNEAWTSSYDTGTKVAAIGLGAMGARAGIKALRKKKRPSAATKVRPPEKEKVAPPAKKATAPTPQPAKKPEPTPAPKPKPKGGKVAGKLSTSPSAVRRREKRAAEKERKAQAAARKEKQFSDLRKKQQATAKASMYVKGTKKSKQTTVKPSAPVSKKPKQFSDLRR